jgi:TonB family protein
MTHAVANSMDPIGGTRYEDQSLRQFLIYSIIMHASLAVVIVVSAYIQYRGSAWGGVGGNLGGTKVNLVSAAGIPMPKESVVTDSKAVDPTKGLHKEEPPKPPEPKTDATKIPKFTKEKPLPPSRQSRTLENKTLTPDNAVPYGKGGNPDLPTGFSQTPGEGSSGVTVQGQGGADFASRYGRYIEGVKNRIYSNWNQLSIDATARASRTVHCAVTFTINRDGTVKDVHISESSGNASYDYAALHAVMSAGADHLERLPSDYSGAYVVATLDFNPPSIR